MRAPTRVSLLVFIALMACAEPPPPSNTVTVCQGGECWEQDKDVVIRVDEPSDPMVEARIQSLEELAGERADAAFDLAMHYFRGDEFPRDSYQGVRWLRDAAERGDVRAQLTAGKLYMHGFEETGVDLIEAQKWLAAAAGQGDEEAQQLLAEIEQPLADQRARDAWWFSRKDEAWRWWHTANIYYYRWDHRRLRYVY